MPKVKPDISTLFPKHQRGSLFRQIYLGTGLEPAQAPTTDAEIFGLGATWKYLDDGSNQGSSWKETTYDDSLWSSGPAELGYGDGDEATTVGFGGVASNKYRTTYFRKTVDITTGDLYDSYSIKVMYDDGFALYVNGSEQNRTNLAAGAAYDTFATDGAPETYATFSFSPSAFVDGDNVIAVEMHQVNASSSDMSFDLSLSGIAAVETETPTDTSGGYMIFSAASALGTVDDAALDEISGMFGMRKTGNEGYTAAIHDSNSTDIFIIDRNGDLNSTIDISGVSWSDAEELIGYNDGSTDYLIVCEFGDNSANKTTKYLHRIAEPTVTGSDQTVSLVDTIPFVYPASPTWEGGSNRGDVEAAFACESDGKIYIMSKRETRNFIFSLPIQSSYTGTQTLTYHGEMHEDVAEETGGVISPANAVAACISTDENFVLVKTYNKVYQFYRTDDTAWSDVMTLSAPIEDTNYVGRGDAPSQERQGESITFEYNDQGYMTISEFNGQSSTPLFYYPLESIAAQSITITHGVNGYTGGVDTYVWEKLANQTTNYSDATTIISDLQAGDIDQRIGIQQFNDLDTLFTNPNNVVVTSAVMRYWVAVEGQGFTLNESLTALPDLTTITWDTIAGSLSAGSGVAWDATPFGTWAGDDGYVGSIDVSLTNSVVQDWIRNPDDFHGFYNIATNTDGQQLSSNEAPDTSARPTLIITYTE